jgi:hypothetical protein
MSNDRDLLLPEARGRREGGGSFRNSLHRPNPLSCPSPLRGEGTQRACFPNPLYVLTAAAFVTSRGTIPPRRNLESHVPKANTWATTNAVGTVNAVGTQYENTGSAHR